jgi:4-amino-4-deoxy-L-arabinose transferase-like glycosyltransferase
VRRTGPPDPSRDAADASGEWTSRLTFGPHYFTLDHPPVARYLIGLGRRLHGFTPADLNHPWHLALSPEENARAGNVPSPGLLLAARRTTTLLGVASGLLLFGLVRQAAGRVAGFLFVLLFAASGYLQLHLRRAMGDPVLLFFTALALWAGARALRARKVARADSDGEAPRTQAPGALAWLAAMGVAAGLAGASKLNGLGVAGAGVVVAAVVAFHPRVPGGPGRRLASAAGGALLVLASCAVTFFVVSPSLHPRPVAHLKGMLELRARELAGHRVDPRWGLADPVRRAQVVLGRTLKHYTVTRVALLNALLGALGLLSLWRAARRWAEDARGPAAAVALLAGALFMSGPALTTPVDWDRYYMFPVVFLTVLLAVGVAALPGEVRRLRGARAEAARRRREGLS